MLSDGAKESFLKKKLDEMMGTDLFDKVGYLVQSERTLYSFGSFVNDGEA